MVFLINFHISILCVLSVPVHAHGPSAGGRGTERQGARVPGFRADFRNALAYMGSHYGIKSKHDCGFGTTIHKVSRKQ